MKTKNQIGLKNFKPKKNLNHNISKPPSRFLLHALSLSLRSSRYPDSCKHFVLSILFKCAGPKSYIKVIILWVRFGFGFNKSFSGPLSLA